MSSLVSSQLLPGSPALLLLVWLHGFKGGDDTFESFPGRLTFLLSETWPRTKCTSLIYPAYDTRGSLSKASEIFLDWLTVKTTEHETALANELDGHENKHQHFREQAHVILLGHSMGGLVIADATLKLLRERDSQTDLKESIIWPGIIGLIGYDTPYFGLNPTFFANTANEFFGHARTAQEVISNLGMAFGFGAAVDRSSSERPRPTKSDRSTTENEASNSKKSENRESPERPSKPGSNWLKVGLAAVGIAGLAAAAGTTYMQKDRITENIGWATSHLDYVKELFETDQLNQRMSNIFETQPVINFHCFYTELPKLNTASNDRHFIIVPTSKTEPKGIHTKFTANQNSKASNEIIAHTTMFNQKLNSGYWNLGEKSSKLISDWLHESHRRRIELTWRSEDGDRPPVDPTSQFKTDPDHRDRLSNDARTRFEREVGDQASREEL